MSHLKTQKQFLTDDELSLEIDESQDLKEIQKQIVPVKIRRNYMDLAIYTSSGTDNDPYKRVSGQFGQFIHLKTSLKKRILSNDIVDMELLEQEEKERLNQRVNSQCSDLEYLLEKIPKDRAKRIALEKKEKHDKKVFQLFLFTTILCICVDVLFYIVLQF